MDILIHVVLSLYYQILLAIFRIQIRPLDTWNRPQTTGIPCRKTNKEIERCKICLPVFAKEKSCQYKSLWPFVISNESPAPLRWNLCIHGHYFYSSVNISEGYRLHSIQPRHTADLKCSEENWVSHGDVSDRFKNSLWHQLLKPHGMPTF